MGSLSAYASEQESLGYFRIFATPPSPKDPKDKKRREITIFRGAPITVTSVSTADPFTEATSQLQLPMVTVFDTPGEGDLDWLVPETDIDIVFENTGAYDFGWQWEGYIASYSLSLSGASNGFTVDLKGALYALDNYLAIPGFPKRPIPYEILMAMDFDQAQHPCRLGQFQILWPKDWDNTVPEFKDPKYLSALKPWGVATDDLWTGFTSRSTGSWEPMLTGHIQTMLTSMYASGGRQWSIRNLGLRRPQLFLRKAPLSHDSRIIEVQLGAPGIQFDATRDFTQRADVIYGSGQDEAGISFSGMQVTPDGKTTYYQPFAYSATAYPRTNNPHYRKRVTPKETVIRFEPGIDEIAATRVAQVHYERFADPGLTGSLTLTADVRYADGSLCPRLLIRAGSTIRINGLLGIKEGVMAHITQATSDFKAMSTQIQFDTKYRDALTVAEVTARNRDSLSVNRLLQVGKYSNTIQDLILPWSYKAGSGIIPTEAKKFYSEVLSDTDVWPYEKQTRAHPPSNPSFRPWYIKLDKMDPDDCSKNWTQASIPIRMGQQFNIRLTQIAAYDRDGNVLPVKFHVSLYASPGVKVQAMPQFPNNPEGVPPPPGPAARETPVLPYLKPRPPGHPTDGTDRDRAVIPHDWKHNQYNPFFQAAWQAVDNNGFTWPWGSAANVVGPGADFVVGWGNYYEPAGYAPGRFSKGADRTGLLEDTSTWAWDLSKRLDSRTNHNNSLQPYAGMLFVMIYCDDNKDQPVFFQGRLIRSETGVSS